MGVTLLLTTLGFGAALFWGAPRLVHRAFRAPRVPETQNPGDFGLPFREVAIPTRNRRRLFGWLIPPPTASAPAVIVVHGWGGNAQAMLPFAATLHRAGFTVLLFDARNHGRSEADDFSSMVKFAEDIDAAREWLVGEEVAKGRCIALLGHSVGAAASLLAASRAPHYAAVVSLASFAHPDEVMDRILTARGVRLRPLVHWVLAYIERTIGARYGDIAPARTIRRVGCPVLLLHGEADRRVPVADAHLIFANRASERVRLITVADAGHDTVGPLARLAPAIVEFLTASIADKNCDNGREPYQKPGVMI